MSAAFKRSGLLPSTLLLLGLGLLGRGILRSLGRGRIRSSGNGKGTLARLQNYGFNAAMPGACPSMSLSPTTRDWSRQPVSPARTPGKFISSPRPMTFFHFNIV